MRYLPLVAVLWAGAGVVLAVADRFLWDTIWVGVTILWGIHILAGVVVFGLGIRRTVRGGQAMPAVLGSGAVIVAGAVLYLTHNQLARYGERRLLDWRFTRDLPVYEDIVASSIAEDSGLHQRVRGSVRYLIDPGPPRRVAFPQPGGLLDNWEAIVYDPTGAVARARGFTPDYAFTAPVELQKLFGGDLVLCRQVTGHYYRCYFT